MVILANGRAAKGHSPKATARHVVMTKPWERLRFCPLGAHGERLQKVMCGKIPHLDKKDNGKWCLWLFFAPLGQPMSSD